MSETEQKDALRVELERKVFEAFKVFDHEDNNAVDRRDVGAIVRSLNCCPTESELQEIVVQVEDVESSSFVRLEKFLPVVVNILEEGRYPPSTYDKLFAAFQMLDKDRKGYLDWHELVELIQKHGEGFSDVELGELSSSSTAFVYPITKRVDYRDWITWMLSDD